MIRQICPRLWFGAAIPWTNVDPISMMNSEPSMANHDALENKLLHYVCLSYIHDLS